jgi:hypothetical protein
MVWQHPPTCGNPTCGKPLAYPNVAVSWGPCDCQRATGRPRGHDKARCLTCDWQARSNDCDELRDGFPINPPHNGTGNPADRGYPVRR